MEGRSGSGRQVRVERRTRSEGFNDVEVANGWNGDWNGSHSQLVMFKPNGESRP